MALDLTYPEIIGSFGDLIGGIEWWNGQTPNKGTIRIGSVKDVDISVVDPDVNVSDATSYKIDAIDINDKLCIQLRFWYDDHVTYGKILRANAYLKNKVNGNTLQMNGASSGRPYVTGFLSGMDNGASGGNFFYVSPAMAATYKGKLCLITEYPTPTFADGFGIILLLPTVNTKFPATIQSWADITDNKMGDSSSKFYWETIPEGADSIYYPFAGAAREVLWVNDYVYFTNFLKQLDPSATLDDIITVRDADDPVQDVDPSKPGGGGGSWDKKTDPVDFPGLPTGGALRTGGCKAYIMQRNDLLTMFMKLWNKEIFDIDNFQRLFEDPMEAIISLQVLPVTPSGSVTNAVYIGTFDTTVTGISVDNQYLTVDCGAIELKEFWGSALDYSPYTKVDICLPFIGIKQLNVEDVMNNTIHIKYNVDVLTGDCIAFIKCGESVLYKYNGNLLQTSPVSSQTNDLGLNALKGSLSAIASIAAGAAVGGAAGAAMKIGGAGVSAANAVSSSKVTTQRVGNISGGVSLMDDFVPYLIVHRPIQSLAKTYAQNKGYTSNISATLSSLSGYTEVEYIHLIGISGATDAELNEIERLLKSGVLI